MLAVAVPKRNKLQNIIVLTPKDGKIFRPEDKEAAAMSWDELKREEHILREKLANQDRNA